MFPSTPPPPSVSLYPPASSMAVQAQNPANTLTDLRNRPVQFSNIDLSSMDPRNFLVPFPFGNLDGRQQAFPASPAIHSHQRMFQPVASATPGPMIPNFVMFQQQPVMDAAACTAGHRKKRKESTDRRSQQQLRQQSNGAASALQPVDLNRAQGCSPAGPQSGVVSTGLRLALDDDRSTVTSSRPDAGSIVVSMAIGDELSAQLLQQQDELSQLLRFQTEQLRHALEERTQLHSKALLATVEEEVSHRLRDRETELERVSRRNLELEERIKHLSLETHVWQSKAKNFEAMVAVLRANLQQALVHQSRGQNKAEGCGESDADDAASAHIDDKAEAQQSRAMMMMARKAAAAGEVTRACKMCRAKEVSILLLPCLHLCLCSDCKVDVERCPICNSHKSACVEVYLS